MGAWYAIGLLAGIGAGLGVLFVGMLAALRYGALVGLALAAAIAVGIGFGAEHWPEALAGGLGAVCGVAGARQVVAGALRRGGTRGGTALLVGGTALVIAGLAFVPALGYLEALALLALGARLRARAAQRYAGLRILARD
ncbi:MAG TPA: hypothetical protein VFL66_11475 [Gaiellaceae bacterium]|nr:hypothetical protein [Gaiellaceae bacterium]